MRLECGRRRFRKRVFRSENGKILGRRQDLTHTRNDDSSPSFETPFSLCRNLALRIPLVSLSTPKRGRPFLGSPPFPTHLPFTAHTTPDDATRDSETPTGVSEKPSESKPFESERSRARTRRLLNRIEGAGRPPKNGLKAHVWTHPGQRNGRHFLMRKCQ